MSAPTTDSLNIVVTGFGPFAGHESVNASWEAVRALPAEHRLADGRRCRLDKRLVEVTYQAVDEAVAQIWSATPAPDLVIHCGVHGTASAIHLECNSRNGNFCKADWRGELLPMSTAERRCAEAKAECDSRLCTALDVERLVRDLERCHPEAKYLRSEDVGNYLCGYIYFKSLDHSADRTLFVHVPPVDAPFSTATTSQALLHTIEKCVAQLKH